MHAGGPGGLRAESSVLASDAGYGFVTTLEDLQSRQRIGKSVLTLPRNSRVLPLRPLGDSADFVAAVSRQGRLLVFPSGATAATGQGQGVQTHRHSHHPGGGAPGFPGRLHVSVQRPVVDALLRPAPPHAQARRRRPLHRHPRPARRQAAARLPARRPPRRHRPPHPTGCQRAVTRLAELCDTMRRPCRDRAWVGATGRSPLRRCEKLTRPFDRGR